MVARNLFIVVGFCAWIQARAETVQSIQVLKVSPTHKSAIITKTDSIQIGSTLIAHFDEKKSCSFRVIKIKGEQAFIESLACDMTLHPGQTLEGDLHSSHEEKLNETDFTRNPTGLRNLTDLALFVDKGHFLFHLVDTQSHLKQTYALNSTGVNLLNGVVSSQEVEGTVSYGLSEQLQLNLTGAQLSSKNLFISYGSGSPFDGFSSSSESAGPEDPTFGVTSRFYEQPNSYFTFDSSIDFSPKAGTAVGVPARANGNGYRGGNMASIDFELSRKIDRWNYSIEVRYSALDSEKSFNSDSGIETDQTASSSLSLIGRSQYAATDRFFLRTALQTSSYAGYTQTTAGSSDVVYGSYRQNSIGVGIVSLVVPRSLAVSIDYFQGLGTTGPLRMSGFDFNVGYTDSSVKIGVLGYL